MHRFPLLLIVCFFLAMSWQAHGQGHASKQAKIKSAMSAGPSSISADVTIKDHDGSILRKGTNGWTCFPDDPDKPAENPYCVDQEWASWYKAFRNGEKPKVTQAGISYMLQGGSPGNNLDPSADKPTSDNQWMEEVKPHLMLIYPDSKMYESLPTDPQNGGPWVMWPNVVSSHLMPISWYRLSKTVRFDKRYLQKNRINIFLRGIN